MTVRTALIVTSILAAMFAAVSLLDSLYWVGVWAAVCAASFIAQDVAAHVEHQQWQREVAKAYHPSRWNA